MKRMIAIAALALAPSGCASGKAAFENFVTPDGRAGHIVYCDGVSRTMATCYEGARELCKGNYSLIRENVTPRKINEGVSTENRSIQIVCAS